MVESTSTQLFDDEDLAEEEAGSGMPMAAPEVTAAEGEDDEEADDSEGPEDEDGAEDDDEIDA